MTIQRKNPFGPLDLAALAAFEQQLKPLRLPDDLRQFLIDFNGAHFVDSAEFDEIQRGNALGNIFGLHSGPEYLRLDWAWVTFAEFVPRPLLVFAADPYGNYFALSLDGKDRGGIYFVDHERLPARLLDLPKVANTFTALLKRAGAELAPPQAHADIVRAIRTGDHDAVREFLANGVPASGQVHHAVHRGDPAILQTIMDAGGSPDERGGIGGSETPLFVAARTGRADLAALLIERGADVNLRCSAGGTALEMATPYPKVFAVLARAGAEPTTRRLREMVQRLRGGD